ncbi:complex I subunit 4 family protein [Verrucomicrobiota bacterium sgz303538]
MLNLLILIPIVAAIGILLRAPARPTALFAAIAEFAISVFAFLSYDRVKGGFQFAQRHFVAPEWGLSYYLAADGLSLVMLLLTGLVTLAAVWLTPKIERRENLFYACVLFITAGCAGAFASQDLFFFYAFHELALIPTFLLIGIWGSGERHAVAWKITIYLALGSFVLLIGLIDLYQSLPLGLRTFDMVQLQQLGSQAIPAAAQGRPFLLLLIGFGILISLFPFHSWAPSAYASAPTPAAMLHAGVLKKFGLYGLIRLAVPLLPLGAKQPIIGSWSGIDILLVLLVGNILYVGLVTIAQRKLDLMLGYSSVMHMGYIFLGLAAMNIVGLSGASLLMFAHGLSIAALFAITGMIRERQLSLSFDSLGGLAKPLPALGLAFGMAAFASIGLPGFGNFASEVMVFFGAFKNGPASLQFSPTQIATIVALWGVVISAVYMLRAYRAVFLGEPEKSVAGWENPALIARWPVILLLAVLLLSGFAPNYFLSFIRPTIEALLR